MRTWENDRANPSSDRRNVTVVLVHGINSTSETWRSLRTAMADDPLLAGQAVVAFDYESKPLRRWLKRRTPTQAEVAVQLGTFVDAQVPNDHDVVFIAHSQGGLIVQRLVADLLEQGRGHELTRVRAVALLACPNSGSEVAMIARRFAGAILNPQERSLRVLDPEIARARAVILERTAPTQPVSATTCPIEFRVFAGATDGIVTSTSAQGLFPKRVFGILDGDHREILDFANPNGTRYLALRRIILAAREPHASSRLDHPAPAGATAIDLEPSVPASGPGTQVGPSTRADADGHYRALHITSPGAPSYYLHDLELPISKQHLGREDTLRDLRQRAGSSGTSVVCIYGGEGEGKSALVFNLLSTLAAEDPPYAAVDAVVHWSFSGMLTASAVANVSAFLETANTTISGGPSPHSDDYLRMTGLLGLLHQRRSLLVLEGFDSLLKPEDPYEIANPVMRMLITTIAREGLRSGGLVLITATRPVKELEYFGFGENVRLPPLKTRDCALLLESLGVRGRRQDLEAIARQHDNYPLALSLLAKDMQRRGLDAVDVRARAEEFPESERLKTVLAYYDGCYPEGSQEKTALYLLSLFPRSATWNDITHALDAVRTETALTPIEDADWDRVCASLEDRGFVIRSRRPTLAYRLTPRVLQRHTSHGFKSGHPKDFRTLHGALAQACIENYRPGAAPTLAELEPLYDQVHHLCNAGDYRGALDVFWNDLSRGREFYTQKTLGAFSDDLQTFSLFFEPDTWELRPDLGLAERDRAWLLATTAYLLNALGMLSQAEALRVTEIGLHDGLGNRKLAILDRAQLATTQIYQCKLSQAKANLTTASALLEDIDAQELPHDDRYAARLPIDDIRSIVMARTALANYFVSPFSLAFASAKHAPLTQMKTSDAFYVALVLLDGLEKEAGFRPSEVDLRQLAVLVAKLNDDADMRGRPYELAYTRILKALVAWRRGECYEAIRPLLREAQKWAEASGRLDVMPLILMVSLHVVLAHWDGMPGPMSNEIEEMRRAVNSAVDLHHADLFEIEAWTLEVRYHTARADDDSALACIRQILDDRRVSSHWKPQLSSLLGSIVKGVP
jgi:pimeloyl-ACP methyl ester carboxylesterase